MDDHPEMKARIAELETKLERAVKLLRQTQRATTIELVYGDIAAFLRKEDMSLEQEAIHSACRAARDADTALLEECRKALNLTRKLEGSPPSGYDWGHFYGCTCPLAGLYRVPDSTRPSWCEHLSSTIARLDERLEVK